MGLPIIAPEPLPHLLCLTAKQVLAGRAELHCRCFHGTAVGRRGSLWEAVLCTRHLCAVSSSWPWGVCGDCPPVSHSAVDGAGVRARPLGLQKVEVVPVHLPP